MTISAIQFKAWPKTPRLFRDIVVTEKLDGTNSAVHLTPVADWEADLIRTAPGDNSFRAVQVDGGWWTVSAQSRKRIITPGKATDNFGFAEWVYGNVEELVRILGEGLHFGEWWGKGIQRGYGLNERRFSLFNTERHGWLDTEVGNVLLRSVPKLYEGVFDESAIVAELENLRDGGSVAVPGWPTPEGLVVYHTAIRQTMKVTLDDHDRGKWAQ